MEQRMGQNGTVAERAVGDEGVQVHQPAVYRCSVCTVWHTGMWACGRGMFVIVGYLQTCLLCPTVGRVGNAMPMQTGQTPRRLQLQARPAYSSLRLCTYLPTWVGVLPGGGGR